MTWKFPFDPERGTLGDRSIFVDHTGTHDRPDGACVDADGFIWTAIFAGGRVVRFSPAGEIDRVIELPVANPTCACLGGRDLKTLYITTARKFLSRQQLRQQPFAGSVLAIEVSVPGLPEHRFRLRGT
jgi:sugar lactone lactonase YvrE